jgi:hypothetical protein
MEIIGSFDVVVVGSGAAGSTAAIASARSGASTLLIEKLPFLGGNSTAVLDTFYGFYTPGEQPLKVVSGIGDDVVDGLRRLGTVLERPNTYGAGTGVTYLAEHLKVVWETLAIASGAKVLLHAFVQGVEVVTDSLITRMTVATKAGLRSVEATVVVDASGDADVCHHAGFSYELAGEVDPAQTLTTTFRMANVDHQRRKTISKEELHALMAEAADSGDYELPRREGSDHITPVEGMTATIMTRLDHVRHGPDGAVINATDPEVLSEAEMAGRRQALEYARFLVDKVPGYEKASLIAMGSQIGMRETRRVHGDYRVTREDVLTARQFDDQIGLCGAPIEDHVPGEGTIWEYLPERSAVGIPLRSLIPKDGVNVLTPGRCFSATHDAQASIRSMAQCMAMGQAAGTLAALAAQGAGLVRSVEFADLRDRLLADGAILELPR